MNTPPILPRWARFVLSLFIVVFGCVVAYASVVGARTGIAPLLLHVAGLIAMSSGLLGLVNCVWDGREDRP